MWDGSEPLDRMAAASRLHLSHTQLHEDIRQTTLIRSRTWSPDFVVPGLQIVEKAAQQIHCHQYHSHHPTISQLRSMQQDPGLF